MYTIKVDEKGYFCGWNINKEMYFSDTLSPIIIREHNRAYDLAKEINEKTGKRVWVYKLTEDNHNYFPQKKTLLKDLKKGDSFLFYTNDNDVYMVISEEEFVCINSGSRHNRFGMFYKSEVFKNDEVKKIPIGELVNDKNE